MTSKGQQKKIGQKWTKACEAHVPIIMSKVVYFAQCKNCTRLLEEIHGQAK